MVTLAACSCSLSLASTALCLLHFACTESAGHVPQVPSGAASGSVEVLHLSLLQTPLRNRWTPSLPPFGMLLFLTVSLPAASLC